MAWARGVLPHRQDKVMTNPVAQGSVVTVTLRPDVDRDAAQAWLGRAEQGIAELRDARSATGDRVATIATGFGPSFFTVNGTERFFGVVAPAGFAHMPAVPSAISITADVVFYIMSTAEGVTARFLHLLWDTRPDVVSVTVERGYHRLDGTEPFGYRDGVRNLTRTDRGRIVFVDPDRHADEPAFAVDGTYMAYLRITQNLDAFRQIPPEAQDRTIGRARDGRRLDLPSGTDPHTEGDITSDQIPVNSHVRKTGPRGQGNDTIAIFRRGLPFCETSPDGTLTAGLQFVSFQASLDQFDVVFNRWMLNQNFPIPNAGPDALTTQNLITIDKHGFFFVPAETDHSIATTLFRTRGKPTKTRTGRIAVRKHLTDAPTGAENLLDLHGFRFQLTGPDGTTVGDSFSTDAAGHALSEEVPAGNTW